MSATAWTTYGCDALTASSMTPPRKTVLASRPFLRRHDRFTPVVEVTIENAHWTNVSGLRVGMGYYE
jgi:hypothetical protein